MMTYPNTTPLTIAITALTLLGASSPQALADTVVVDQVRFPKSSVFAFEEGKVRFRTKDGAVRSAWIDEVELLMIDQGGLFDDFNQAERFLAAGQAQRATVRYQRAMRVSQSFWPDLVAARLLMAADAADRIDLSARIFFRVMSGRPMGITAAARLFPQSMPVKRDGRTVRALTELDSQLVKKLDPQRRALARLLQYTILKQSGDARAVDMQRDVALQQIPSEAGSSRVYAAVFAALSATLADHADGEELEALDRAIASCPKQNLPDFLLLKGRTALQNATTRDDSLRAAWAFMRVVIHFANDPRVAEGLYGAALSLEQARLPDRAVGLLRECVEHKTVSPEMLAKARAALQRLTGTPRGGDE